jgi:hypothetical protein
MFFNLRQPTSRQAAQQQMGAFQNAPMPRNLGEGLTSLGSGLEYRQLRNQMATTPDTSGFPPAPTGPSAMQRIATALMGSYNPTGAGVPQQTGPSWGRNDGQQPAMIPTQQAQAGPTGGIDLSKVFGWGSPPDNTGGAY